MKFDFTFLQEHTAEVVQATRDIFAQAERSAKGVSRRVGRAIGAWQSGASKNALATVTLSSRFKTLCIVGLNKTEYVPLKGEASVFGENWQDMIDDATRRHTGLLFFAPRDLGGVPVNPYLFLAGDELDTDDEEEQALFMQNIGSLALFDFCRLPDAPAGEVGLLLAGDVLFHWDSEDTYIVPTTLNGWPRDVMQIVNHYPKKTNLTLYTNWSTDIFAEVPPNLNLRPLFDAPLVEETWVNQPTFQEKNGGKVLLAGIVFALLFGGLLYLQNAALGRLDDQISIVEQQIPREGKYMRLARPIREQEAQMRYREIFPLLVQDAARTIQASGMKVDNFEVRNPTPQNPPAQMVTTIEAERDAYKGWLQEEPIAKAILLNSATFTALRKPPGNSFKLEGLVDLPSLAREYAAAKRRQVETDGSPAAASVEGAE